MDGSITPGGIGLLLAFGNKTSQLECEGNKREQDRWFRQVDPIVLGTGSALGLGGDRLCLRFAKH